MNDEAIDRMVAGAGARPKPDDAVTQRVLDAVEGQWRGQFGEQAKFIKRARLRWTVGVAMAASLVAAVMLNRPQFNSDPDNQRVGNHWAQVARSIGPLRLVRNDQPLGAMRGTWLNVGETLDTGVNGAVVLILPGGREVRLENAMLKISSSSDVQLLRGRMYIDSHGAANSLRIMAGAATVRDVGTQFVVDLRGETTRILVREGSVSVRAHRTDMALTATAEQGEALLIDRSGFARSAVATNSQEWQWTQRISPGYVGSARSVDAFLKWAASELGEPLRYSTPAAETLATRTRFKGDLADLSAGEAIPVVLASTSLVRESATHALRIGVSAR